MQGPPPGLCVPASHPAAGLCRGAGTGGRYGQVLGQTRQRRKGGVLSPPPPSSLTNFNLVLLQVLLLSVQDRDSPSLAAQLAQEVRQQSLQADKQGATPLTLSQLVGVAVAMFSLVGAGVCFKGGVAEEVELKEAFAALACKWRECDADLLSETLGLGRCTVTFDLRMTHEECIVVLLYMHVNKKGLNDDSDPFQLGRTPMLA